MKTTMCESMVMDSHPLVFVMLERRMVPTHAGQPRHWSQRMEYHVVLPTAHIHKYRERNGKHYTSGSLLYMVG